MSAPLVSVLLPAYNSAATIVASLATVEAQDWPAWELIVVDDGSSDDTYALAQAFAARHPARVRLIAHGANRGSGAARNSALAASCGAYVASLDADDLWAPTKLRCQVAALEAHPAAALVWGPGWYADAGGAPTELQRVPLSPAPTLLPVPELAALMLDGVFPFTSSLLMRRAAVVAVGGYELLVRGQDMSLLFKLAAAHPTLYDPEPRCSYRQHEGSSTRRSERRRLIARHDQAYLRWVEGFLRATPCTAHLAPRAAELLAQQEHQVAEELTATGGAG